ncbi:MAG: hypothetical protein ACOCV1_04170, partial [Bacillota bacterium]
MKRILIKKYENSPPLGTIIEWDEKGMFYRSNEPGRYFYGFDRIKANEPCWQLIEDNSMLPLDNYLRDYLELWEDQELGNNPSLKDYNEFLKIQLKNSVETNKEQPILKCPNCGKYNEC